MSRAAPAAAAGLLAVLLTLTGCSGSVTPPGESDVAVDTPELRELKAAAGIEECVPGTGESGLPELTLACLGGGPDVDLSTLTGPLVLNLWNTACTPCLEEMPALQQFHERYGDRVALVGIDVTDTQPASAIRFAKQVGATYPQLADPGGEIFEQRDLPLRAAYPQFVFVDAAGEVSGPVSGGVDSVDEVVELVEEQLGVTL